MPGPDSPIAAAGFGPRDWLFAAALLAAVIVVYQPAWHGGLVWDDDEHITSPELRSWHGLYRIWFDVRATLQYYPLLHSAFWIEHRLWGDDTLGYHLVNIFLHTTAALMAALVLRRLAIPGAYLAAAIFALHPVHVESVAWITEQKNTLSAVFYLGSLLAYLRFDQTRKLSSYFWSLGLFVLGILSKTVIATLPGALLVIFWWQRGRLSWKNDVLPLAPFLLLGAGGGMITAWWELEVNNCVGPLFTLTFVERCLIAGRNVWFLLWKLFWPTQLTFSYPRWQIDAGTWWQYAFPLGAALLLAALWAIRRWTRAPLAAVLFFGGTLFPMLGFFNLYTFLYSFVANHYQYLASLGIIALSAAGIALALDRWRLWGRPGAYLLCLALLVILGDLTWRQSHMYSDIEMLYRTTIAENPDCWMARNNLGTILIGRGQLDEAMSLFRRVVEINGNDHNGHNNIGLVLVKQGKFDEAMAEYRKALKLKPNFANAHYNLGLAFHDQGHLPEAIAEYRIAIGLKPRLAVAHNNLGNALAAENKLAEAVIEYRKSLEITPDNADAHNNLGGVLSRQGRLAEAAAECQEALRLDPHSADAHSNLGNIWLVQSRFDEAVAEYRKALEIKPADSEARYNVAAVLYQRGKMPEAIAEWRELLRLEPSNVNALNQLARALATNPDASLRNGAKAVALARQAAKLTGGGDPNVLDTLAAALAEAGRFAEAIETAERARGRASSQNDTALADAVRARIKLYEAGTPFRETQQSSPPTSSHP